MCGENDDGFDTSAIEAPVILRKPKKKPKLDALNFPSLGKTGEVYEPPKVKVSSKLTKK